MRIGIDCRPLQDNLRAGIAYYLDSLLKKIAYLDQKNEYILFTNGFNKMNTENVPKYKYSNFRQVNFRIPNIFFSGISGTPFSKLFPIERFIDRIDVFHATNYLLTYSFRANSILNVYDLSILKFPNYHPLKRRLIFQKGKIRYSCLKSKCIVTCSKATKMDIMETFNIPSEKIKVVYGAISGDFKNINNERCIDCVLEKYELPKKYILYVGTLEPRKNLERLIEAFKQVKDKFKGEYKLVLIGGKGWLYQGMFEVIDKLNLSKDIICLGYVFRKDLPYLFNGATVFVYPSLYEGFGLPPLEAMACGIPTLVSNISSLPEVVGDAALKVDPYSVDAIADGMLKILTDGDLRTSLVNKAIERSKNFSWEKSAQEMLNIYNEVYDKK